MNKLYKLVMMISIGGCLATALTADQILKEVDLTAGRPQDQNMTLLLTVIDKRGYEQKLEIVMQQKGVNMRTGRFIAPAEKKGIAFLSLPDGVMYLYLPAYKKTRRIASHLKNTKFAGTDFTYEDMEAINYSAKWRPTLVSESESEWVLQLVPRDNSQSEYSKIILKVQRESYYPVSIDYYGQSGEQCKIMKREQIEKIDGYWIARRSELFDLRSGNRTIMEVKEVAYDTGLSSDLFTERYLER